MTAEEQPKAAEAKGETKVEAKTLRKDGEEPVQAVDPARTGDGTAPA